MSFNKECINTDLDLSIGDKVYYLWLKTYKEIECPNCKGEGGYWQYDYYSGRDWASCNATKRVDASPYWVVNPTPKEITHILIGKDCTKAIFDLYGFRMNWLDSRPRDGVDVDLCFKSKELADKTASLYNATLRDAERIVNHKGRV